MTDQRYWDPQRRMLVSGEWHREYELLAGDRLQTRAALF